MQYFVTFYNNDTPTTRFLSQMNSPKSLYLMKNDNNFFIIEPTRDHTLQNDRLKLGSFYKTAFKIANNSKVILESYEKEIIEADILVIEGRQPANFYKILKTIKYINVGFKLENCEIIKINNFSLNDEILNFNDIPLFFRFTDKTRIYNASAGIELHGLEKQEKKFEALIYSTLIKRRVLNKYGLNLNVLFTLNGDKGMKKDVFLKKICQKNCLNYYEYDFMKNGDDILRFKESMKQVEEMKPCVVVLKNYITKSVELVSAIESQCEKNKSEDCEFGYIFIFLTDKNEQYEFIRKRFDIDVNFTIENPNKNDRIRIINNILSKVPNDITKKSIDEIAEALNSRSIKEIECIFGKIIENKLYNMEKSNEVTENKLNFASLSQKNNIIENFENYSNLTNSYSKQANEIKLEKNEETDNINGFYSDFTKKSENLIESLKKLEIDVKRKEKAEKELFLHYEDIKTILNKKIIRPNEEGCQKTNIFFKDIGGYEDVKQILTETFIWPLLHKDMFASLNIKPIKGVLFYGPPGCSKTLFAKAISNESKMSFISIKGSELEDKYVGETGRAIRNLFNKARKNAPCIIFIDEIDSISRKISDSSNDHHSKTLASFLTEMDGIEEISDVIVVGATNRIESIDPAFMRPGRIDKIINIGLPNKEARKKIFELKLDGVETENLDFEILVTKSKHLSGAEITLACQEALMMVLREKINENKTSKIDTEILLNAIKKISRKKAFKVESKKNKKVKIK